MGHSAQNVAPVRNAAPSSPAASAEAVRPPVLLVVEEQAGLADSIAELCAFLDIKVARTQPGAALATALRGVAPIGVLTESDADGLRICTTLKTIASYDPSLPTLVVTDGSPTILGTLDGAEYLWRLTGVARIADTHNPGAVVDFLARAGRRNGTGRLLSV